MRNDMILKYLIQIIIVFIVILKVIQKGFINNFLFVGTILLLHRRIREK